MTKKPLIILISIFVCLTLPTCFFPNAPDTLTTLKLVDLSIERNLQRTSDKANDTIQQRDSLEILINPITVKISTVDLVSYLDLSTKAYATPASRDYYEYNTQLDSVHILTKNDFNDDYPPKSNIISLFKSIYHNHDSTSVEQAIKDSHNQRAGFSQWSPLKLRTHPKKNKELQLEVIYFLNNQTKISSTKTFYFK